MMFNTIYRLRLEERNNVNNKSLKHIFFIIRISIKDNSRSFPIHLYTLKDKEPSFNDLVKKIQRITQVI